MSLDKSIEMIGTKFESKAPQTSKFSQLRKNRLGTKSTALGTYNLNLKSRNEAQMHISDDGAATFNGPEILNSKLTTK